MNDIKYRIEFLDEDNKLRTATIYDYRIQNKDIVIIESENHMNPTNYTEKIYDLLKLDEETIVILDLINIYGISKDSLYQWIFIIEKSELVDEEFIPISKIDWFSKEYMDKNNLVKSYLLKKIKNLNTIIAV